MSKVLTKPMAKPKPKPKTKAELGKLWFQFEGEHHDHYTWRVSLRRPGKRIVFLGKCETYICLIPSGIPDHLFDYGKKQLKRLGLPETKDGMLDKVPADLMQYINEDDY